MKKIITMCATAVALTSGGAMQNANAHTQEWYADHLVDAQATQSRCLARLKAGERISQDEMEECHRASGAVVHSTKFKPIPPKSY
jgi:hypothetical protein